MNSQNSQAMVEMDQKSRELAVALKQLASQAEQQYSVEVETILRDQCRDHQRIENLLDGMLDFCFDDQMLRLYKDLCRYYFKIDPEATVSYINAYREMWDEGENFKNSGYSLK